MKLWDKGISLDKKIEAFTVGDDYVLDMALLPYDCQASAAHAKMLGKIGILTKKEVQQLLNGLKEILDLHRVGKFTITPEQEDCHTAIESYLTEQYGVVGQKIHTARSRNDQVLTAMRLFCKSEFVDIQKALKDLTSSLGAFAKKYRGTPLPGFTHTRKAMPSSVGLWARCYRDALSENDLLIKAVFRLIDQSPLGTAAGYGVNLPLDRQYTANELGFAKVQANPIYSQHSRGKFEISILHTLSQILFDINRMATDLILFSMPDFGFFKLPEAFCTGSSIMPQKKNPDVLELLRSQYHTLLGYEASLKSRMANQISGYHRDIQLSKAPLIYGFETTASCIEVTAQIIEGLEVDRDRCKKAMTEELYATERVYELVASGMPFREAYRQIAKTYQ